MSTEQYTPESDWARSLRAKANHLALVNPCYAPCCTSDRVAAQAARNALGMVGHGYIKSIHQFLDYLSEATRQLQIEEMHGLEAQRKSGIQ